MRAPFITKTATRRAGRHTMAACGARRRPPGSDRRLIGADLTPIRDVTKSPKVSQRLDANRWTSPKIGDPAN